MIILSLFDGISCAYEALVRAGIPITKYYASEVDKYAIEVSKKRHPDIVHLGDVKGVKAFPVDLLIGGSPCQDLSVAKKGRQGLDGERSKLFFEYVRLLDECKPKYFILENVASMSDDSRNLISLVMGVEPIMIDASLVSAQSRKRYFWTNIPTSIPEDKGIKLKDILLKDVDEKYFVKGELKKSNNQGYRVKDIEGKSNTLMANSGGVGYCTGLYRIGYIGNTDGQANRVYSDSGKSPTLMVGCRPLYKIGQDVGQRLDKNGTRKDNLVVGDIIRRLTPIECERLQSLPDNYTEGISDNQRYKCLGNAFNVEVIAHILKSI